LEQAAGAVISALVNDGKRDEAAKLVRYLGGLLATSCMWISADNDSEPKTTMSMGRLSRFSRLVRVLQARCSPIHNIGNPTTYAELLPILLRIRRTTRTDCCCQVPEWMFKEANMDVPQHIKTYYNAAALPAYLKGSLFPHLPPSNDSIILSHRSFSIIQRLVHAIFKHWKPDIILRQAIEDLESKVLYATECIDRKIQNSTDNTLLIAHYFFAFQRRLQRKVVSDFGWTTFLKKGQGSKLYQNNLDIVSTFEEELSLMSGEGMVPIQDDVMGLIDETCTLMERYVAVYGQGVKSNLTFTKGERGGSGRGPVDDYNLLCDILAELRKQAGAMGYKEVPGVVHKFLAKDIMNYNDSWRDDAFGGGKVLGWETWLEERRRGRHEDESGNPKPSSSLLEILPKTSKSRKKYPWGFAFLGKIV
jgi:hypothetical protein